MSIFSYSENQILERLRFDNPWWSTGHIGMHYRQMKRRLYFEHFIPLISDSTINRAIVLMGPRRVGKTVLMFHSIERLIENGINPLKIAFISVETPIYNTLGLEQLFALVRKATGTTEMTGWYIFFDEIQYLREWERHLKSLVDSYPESRFVVSGSAAAALRLKSTESGAGRLSDFMLPPLTFHEYIHLKELDRLIIPGKMEWGGYTGNFFGTNNITEINNHFIDYINFGGYPEVVFSSEIQSDPGRYIKSDIIDKVLLRDLPSLYGITDVQELNSLFTVITYNTGNEVSPGELSQTSGVGKDDLRRYMEYLEAAFLIKRIHRTSFKPKKFERANFYKIYLTNTTLRSALFAPMHPTDDLMGNLVETAVFAQWMHRTWVTPYYARWEKKRKETGNDDGEVDLVFLDDKSLVAISAVEIKWSNRYFENPRKLRSLLKFAKENNMSEVLATTIDKEGVISVDDIKLTFVPSAVYAYTIGANTLTQRHRH